MSRGRCDRRRATFFDPRQPTPEVLAPRSFAPPLAAVVIAAFVAAGANPIGAPERNDVRLISTAQPSGDDSSRNEATDGGESDGETPEGDTAAREATEAEQDEAEWLSEQTGKPVAASDGDTASGRANTEEPADDEPSTEEPASEEPSAEASAGEEPSVPEPRVSARQEREEAEWLSEQTGKPVAPSDSDAAPAHADTGPSAAERGVAEAQPSTADPTLRTDEVAAREAGWLSAQAGRPISPAHGSGDPVAIGPPTNPLAPQWPPSGESNVGVDPLIDDVVNASRTGDVELTDTEIASSADDLAERARRHAAETGLSDEHADDAAQRARARFLAGIAAPHGEAFVPTDDGAGLWLSCAPSSTSCTARTPPGAPKPSQLHFDRSAPDTDPVRAWWEHTSEIEGAPVGAWVDELTALDTYPGSGPPLSAARQYLTEQQLPDFLAHPPPDVGTRIAHDGRAMDLQCTDGSLRCDARSPDGYRVPFLRAEVSMPPRLGWEAWRAHQLAVELRAGQEALSRINGGGAEEGLRLFQGAASIVDIRRDNLRRAETALADASAGDRAAALRVYRHAFEAYASALATVEAMRPDAMSIALPARGPSGFALRSVPGGGLAAHERVPGVKGGGHSLRFHVNMSDEQLIDRLAGTPPADSNKKPGLGLPTASTFRGTQTAEIAVAENMTANHDAIQRWLRSGSTEPAEFSFQHTNSIGRSVYQVGAEPLEVSRSVVVLARTNDPRWPEGYFILTAYPAQ